MNEANGESNGQSIRRALSQAIEELIAANPRNSRKGASVQNWFRQHFNESGRCSHVSEAKQAYNRPGEQAKHRPNHILLVYEDEEVIQPLRRTCEKLQYEGLHSVCIAKRLEGDIKLTDILVAEKCPLHAWATKEFPKASVSYIRQGIREDMHAESENVGLEWDSVGDLGSESIGGLVGVTDSARTALAALRAGKHVIFIGPPGTGKTKLAQIVCNSIGAKYKTYTASAEWTTYETLGGYFPVNQEEIKEGHSSLDFKAGFVLDAIAKNEWIIIDELNRADLDKAFGELFTVLSGYPVELPYTKEIDGETRRVTITWDDPKGADDTKYCVPSDWRIIGTMNTFDKASLFQLSYALMRRFAFIDVRPPNEEQYRYLINEWIGSSELSDVLEYDLRSELIRLIESIFVPAEGNALEKINVSVGPAIVEDIIRHLSIAVQLNKVTWDREALAEALIEGIEAYFYPQLEGQDTVHDEIVESLAESLSLRPERKEKTSKRLECWTGIGW